MAAEDQTSQPDTEARDAPPWWDVRHPRTLHLYVGLCWAFTPIALANLHEMLGQHSGTGLMVVGLVWVVGHVALIYCVLRLHLIQRSVGRLLLVAAVMLASVAVGGIALLIFIPDTLSVSDLQLLVGLPQLHTGALALLTLSATRSAPRPSAPHPECLPLPDQQACHPQVSPPFVTIWPILNSRFVMLEPRGSRAIRTFHRTRWPRQPLTQKKVARHLPSL